VAAGAAAGARFERGECNLAALGALAEAGPATLGGQQERHEPILTGYPG